MKRTWNELQEMTSDELAKIKNEELERIESAENERQALIRDILVLQEIPDHTGWRKA